MTTKEFMNCFKKTSVGTLSVVYDLSSRYNTKELDIESDLLVATLAESIANNYPEARLSFKQYYA